MNQMPKNPGKDRRSAFQYLPPVDELLKVLKKGSGVILTPEACTNLARRTIDRMRGEIEEGSWLPSSRTEALERAKAGVMAAASRILATHPRSVINATGVVLHTNLGRAPAAAAALKAIREAASSYSDLEYDLDSGARGSRLSRVEELLCVLTGAEAALAVNNNAAAVFLALNTMASGRQVLVSRGHLVAIGGSFRMPDVMEKSGAKIVEVGTTNKTYLNDYEKAITRQTSLILQVHQSNFIQKGFVHQVPLAELVELGNRHNLPVLDDQGSGILTDPGTLEVPDEPAVQDSLESGAAVVTFSGDKLLGGSQAGIILGTGDWVARMKANPLARAVRLDKLQLAALEATLRLYLTGSENREVPVRWMVQIPEKELERRAKLLSREIKSSVKTITSGSKTRPAVAATAFPTTSTLGGGSTPEVSLVDWGVALKSRIPGLTAARLEKSLRLGSTPVIARVSEEQVILNMRAVFPAQDKRLPGLVARAVKRALADFSSKRE